MLDGTAISVDTRGEQATISCLLFLINPELMEIGRALPVGDLWWGTEEKTYGVELKSTSDLLSSMWSKQKGARLEWQLDNLRRGVDVPILGIHGLRTGDGEYLSIVEEVVRGKGTYHAKIITDTKYTKNSVDGFLLSVQAVGVWVIERNTREDLLRALIELYWWSRKRTHTTFNKGDRRRKKGG